MLYRICVKSTRFSVKDLRSDDRVSHNFPIMSEVIDLVSSSSGASSPAPATVSTEFVLDGRPFPARRPRANMSTRTVHIDPVEKRVKTEVQARILEFVGPDLVHSNDETMLIVKLKFHMSRPQHHFKNNNRSAGELKTNFRNLIATTVKPDNDNCVKFILDAMNGTVYKDDKMRVFIKAVKFFDNDDQCLGKTEVFVAPLTQEALQHELNNW